MGLTVLKRPVAGSKISAEFVKFWLAWPTDTAPPTTRTLPSDRVVEVWRYRFIAIGGTLLKKRGLGSKSSAPEIISFGGGLPEKAVYPPTMRTPPSGMRGVV